MLPLLALLLLAPLSPAFSARPNDPPIGGPEDGEPELKAAIEVARTRLGGLPLGVSVHVRFDALDRNPAKELKGARLELKSGVRLSAGAVADWDYLDATTEPWIKFKASGRFTAVVSGEIESGLLELEGEVFKGVQIDYEVKMPKDSYVAGSFPEPFKPESMPEGSEYLFEASEVRGQAMKMVYRRIALETEHSDWKGMAVGVEKLDGGNVRVVAGPIAGVRNELFLGVALGALKFGVGNTTELKEYRLKIAVYDTSTPEGRDAYLRAFVSGHIEPDEPGAELAGTLTKLTFHSESGASLKVGGLLDLHKTLATNEGERRHTVWPARHEELDEIVLRYNERTYGISTFREQGEVTRQSITVVLRHLNRYLAGYIHEAIKGADRKFSKDVDLQLVMTGDEAMQLQNAAARYLEQRRSKSVGGSAWPVLEDLAKANDPQEVVMALTRPQAGTLAEGLLLLHFQLKENLPGILRVRS